ncbi:MAG: hypothetical protein ACFFDW_12615 [Candidatus Thorarchaeota archaeon]
MPNILKVNQKTINWLLEEENPPVKFLTLTKLLDESPEKDQLNSLKEVINEYRPIKEILEQQKEKSYWFDKRKDKNYTKYLGTYWQVHFLSEMYANRNEGIENAIEHLFSTGQVANGGFSYDGGSGGAIVCLTSNIFRALVHFGYLKDERTQNALSFILERIVDTKGFVNCGDTFSLIHGCYMTLPKTLFAFAAIPEKERSTQVKEGIKICSEKILANHIYKYVPEKNKEWLDFIRTQNFTAQQKRDARTDYLEKKPITNKIAKSGWMKFGFPLSYNSDALDTMYAFALTNIDFSTNMDDALDVILSNNKSGRWINEKKFQNDMYTEIEPYKSESKWLTFRALYVLKKYQKLQIVE